MVVFVVVLFTINSEAVIEDDEDDEDEDDDERWQFFAHVNIIIRFTGNGCTLVIFFQILKLVLERQKFATSNAGASS